MGISQLTISILVVSVLLLSYLFYLNTQNLKVLKELMESKYKELQRGIKQLREDAEVDFIVKNSDEYRDALQCFARTIYTARINGGLVGNVRVSSDAILELFFRRCVSGAQISPSEYRLIRTYVMNFSADAVMDMLYHVYQITDKHKVDSILEYAGYDPATSPIPASLKYRLESLSGSRCTSESWISFPSVFQSLLTDLTAEFGGDDKVYIVVPAAPLNGTGNQHYHLEGLTAGPTTKPE